ncbi:MAG: PAS domain S-box protein, partial [Smithella sp.]
EALLESQQQLSDIINFLPDATLVIDKRGKVIAWNRAMEEMTGINAADMLNKDNYEYSLPFYGERRPILIDLVLQPNKDIEESYTRTDRKNMFLEAEAHISSFSGRDVYLFGKANILRDSRGNVVGAIESIRDVTVRKQAQEALKFSEERFSKAFNMSPAPTTISTIDEGRFIDVNDSFLRMLGYSREEIIGRTVAELSVWPDDNRRRHITRKLIDEGVLRGEAIHYQTKAHEIRKLLVSAEIIVLEGKKFVLAIFYDITDQERLESQLRQSQRLEAIGTLAGGIAHDFNNILGAVMGYTEMALGKPNVDDHLKRYLQHIFKASERARDLVKQILAFSRKSDEKLMPLRVSPIIKEVLKLLLATLPSTIKISQNIYSDSDTVLADPTQIHQILMNLCTNASCAIPEKKGEIKVSLASEKIESDISFGLDSGMYLKLAVSDTGIGMDTKTMGRIFDPFFTTKKPGEGTGLGLSVVYGIVKSYGGTITVQSEVGKGTEFCVYLPLFMKAENHEEKPVESMSGGKERILFVDDEEALVELGENVLSSLGYDVVGKKNSLEALELFSAFPEKFDLVVTDMTMPNMTGIDLAQKILRIKPGIPIILCTGFSETITQESIDSVGVRDLIMKPFKRHQIAESIRRTLDNKE